MKKCFLILLLGFIGLAAFAAGDSQYAKVVNVSSSLNIRASADAQSEILGKLERDATVEVLSTESDGWIRIQYGTIIGYVKSSYLQEVKSSKRKTSHFSFASIWNTYKSVWRAINPNEKDFFLITILKVIACIIVGGLSLMIVGFTLVSFFYAIGFAITILCGGIGGAIIGFLLRGIFISFDFSYSNSWIIWGFWIGCGLGVLRCILNPTSAVEDVFNSMGSSSSNSSHITAEDEYGHDVELKHSHGNVWADATDSNRTYEKDWSTGRFTQIT